MVKYDSFLNIPKGLLNNIWSDLDTLKTSRFFNYLLKFLYPKNIAKTHTITNKLFTFTYSDFLHS
jgi:hypothetical protein